MNDDGSWNGVVSSFSLSICFEGLHIRLGWFTGTRWILE